MAIQRKHIINKHLEKIPDLWKINPDDDNIISFDSLANFLLKSKFIFKEKEGNPLEIAYNHSLMHFLIYYSYYPKISFIYCGDNVIIFACFDGKKYDKLTFSFAYYLNYKSAMKHLKMLLLNENLKFIIEEINVKEIIVRDLDDGFIKFLKNEESYFTIESLKELNYAIYDLNKTLSLSGNQFSNLRWHLNSFEKQNHKVEIIDLHDCVKSVIHLIGKWRSDAIKKRDFSFIDVRSDKMGATFFADTKFIKKYNDIIGPDEAISRVLKVDGKIAAFNLGFPLGVFKKQNVFAHAIGLCDVSISHLAEYAQYDFWKQIHMCGCNYVNDGPTWRTSLKTYKDKFNPIDKKRYYWARIRQHLYTNK